MRRRLQQLSARFVGVQKTPGYYSDGNGLYLQVSRAGSKSWILRYRYNGKTREMGLGPLGPVGLADARKSAMKCHAMLLENKDPIEVRKAERSRQALEKSRAVTFSQCAERYIDAHQARWTNAKHISQWRNTIKTYCDPVFGSLPVRDVDTALVMRALEPIWNKKHETASRLRGRIEAVLDWAAARGFRKGENPARWRGHIDKLLPSLKKQSRVRHHPALPFAEMGAFMRELRQQESVSARALELAILTGARTNEVIGSLPEEFDLENGAWRIPAERMKAGREHRVPLAPRALEIVRQQIAVGCTYLFTGRDVEQSISNMAMLMLLKRMGRHDVVVHGFRSTFRDWVAECTQYPREVAEMALAHAISDQTEAAYRRGDLFEKRRQLMVDWADYCNHPAVILPMRQAG